MTYNFSFSAGAKPAIGASRFELIEGRFTHEWTRSFYSRAVEFGPIYRNSARGLLAR